jgi:steroid delta-isomerase-like uncharacterized protein
MRRVPRGVPNEKQDGCSNRSEVVMVETTSAAVARRWFEEVWNQRREATVHELMMPSASGHMDGADVKGVEQFLAVRSLLLNAFPDLRITVENVVAQGEDVVVRWNVTGTHRGTSLGFSPTHRPVSFRGMTWLRVQKGRIVEGWDAWNQGALFADLRAAAERQKTRPPAE